MSDLELFFDIKLNSLEEEALKNYSGFREINKNSLGEVADIDTRELEPEKLRYKKQLKIQCNQVFLKYTPIQDQLNAALGILTETECDYIKSRMTQIRKIYQDEKQKIESADSLRVLKMPNFDKIVGEHLGFK